MFRRASALVGRAAVRARSVHTEAKLQEMGIELPVPKPPLGKHKVLGLFAGMFKCSNNCLRVAGRLVHLPTSLTKDTGKCSANVF